MSLDYARLGSIVNLVLPCATLLTAIAAIIQAAAARKAANAALLNSESVVKAERAWITAEIGEIPHLGEEPEFESLEMVWVRPTLTNRGRTVSKINKMRLARREVASAQELPSEPIYDGPCFDGEMIVLAPQASISPIAVGVNASDLRKIKRSNRELFVYGFVGYTDVYDRPHEAHFCFRYYVQGGFSPGPDGFYPAGPPAYNRSD